MNIILKRSVQLQLLEEKTNEMYVFYINPVFLNQDLYVSWKLCINN
jgi:hypothetical protein